jgi:hypothetical protein
MRRANERGRHFALRCQISDSAVYAGLREYGPRVELAALIRMVAATGAGLDDLLD